MRDMIFARYVLLSVTALRIGYDIARADYTG